MRRRRVQRKIRIISLDDSKRRELNCHGLVIGRTYPVVREYETYFKVLRDITTFWPAGGWVSKKDVELIQEPNDDNHAT